MENKLPKTQKSLRIASRGLYNMKEELPSDLKQMRTSEYHIQLCNSSNTTFSSTSDRRTTSSIRNTCKPHKILNFL